MVSAQLTLTEYAVLGLLGHVQRAISGYELRKVTETSVGYIWRPSKTQLYVVLLRLLRSGLVTRRKVHQLDRPDKQLYQITEAGRVAIREWLGRDEDVGDPDRSVLVLKLFFGAQGDRDALVRQLAAFRDSYAARLATYESKWQSADRHERDVSDEFTRLTLSYGIARARAAVDWADAALEALTQ
jgi:PadR family transcriptional regulator, regulatory protein AphA